MSAKVEGGVAFTAEAAAPLRTLLVRDMWLTALRRVEIAHHVSTQLRVLVKRILRMRGYPPDKRENATQMLVDQAAPLSAEWETS